MSDRFIKFILIFQFIIVIYLGYLIIKEKRVNKPLKEEYRLYKNYVDRLEKENKELKRKLEYLSDPENLKKELKEKFNLVEPGEKVIILPENF